MISPGSFYSCFTTNAQILEASSYWTNFRSVLLALDTDTPPIALVFCFITLSWPDFVPHLDLPMHEQFI